MALCIIGLFFLVREENGIYACIGQRTIMIFVTVLTAIFQILVNQKFGPFFHFLPFQKRNPRHQTNVKAANKTRQMPNALDKLLHKSMFNMTKKSKDTRHHVAPSSFDDYALRFEDQILRVEDPVVWIPRDEYGFSDEEISYIRSKYSHVWITNENADIDEKCNIKIRQPLSPSLLRAIARRI